ASIALPPARIVASAALDASVWLVATMPWSAIATERSLRSSIRPSARRLVNIGRPAAASVPWPPAVHNRAPCARSPARQLQEASARPPPTPRERLHARPTEPALPRPERHRERDDSASPRRGRSAVGRCRSERTGARLVGDRAALRERRAPGDRGLPPPSRPGAARSGARTRARELAGRSPGRPQGRRDAGHAVLDPVGVEAGRGDGGAPPRRARSAPPRRPDLRVHPGVREARQAHDLAPPRADPSRRRAEPAARHDGPGSPRAAGGDRRAPVRADAALAARDAPRVPRGDDRLPDRRARARRDRQGHPNRSARGDPRAARPSLDAL